MGVPEVVAVVAASARPTPTPTTARTLPPTPTSRSSLHRVRRARERWETAKKTRDVGPIVSPMPAPLPPPPAVPSPRSFLSPAGDGGGGDGGRSLQGGPCGSAASVTAKPAPKPALAPAPAPNPFSGLGLGGGVLRGTEADLLLLIQAIFSGTIRGRRCYGGVFVRVQDEPSGFQHGCACSGGGLRRGHP